MNQQIAFKLLRLALDRCSEHEADSAACKLFDILRKDGVAWDKVWQKLHPGPGNTVMPWGQYKGWSLAEIADKDKDYLAWVADKAKSDFIRRAAQQTLEAFKG